MSELHLVYHFIPIRVVFANASLPLFVHVLVFLIMISPESLVVFMMPELHLI